MSGYIQSRQSTDAHKRIVRLFKIIETVRHRTSAQRIGREELAEACCCDVRTVQRDISLLQNELQIPLEFDRKLCSYRLEDGGWTFPIFELNGEDVIALALARTILANSGVPCQEQIENVLAKIASALPVAFQALIADAAIANVGGVSPRDYSHVLFEPLRRAISNRMSIDMTYASRSSKAVGVRRVDPYAIELRDGRFWELHAWCHKRNDIRTFALDQITDVKSTDIHFDKREAEWGKFTSKTGVVGGIRGGEPITVEAIFDREVAQYAIDAPWPEGLVIESCTDGNAKLTGTVAGHNGIVPDLLRWRRHVRVTGGTELRTKMAEEIQTMHAHYYPETEK